MKFPKMQPSTVVGLGNLAAAAFALVGGVVAHAIAHDPATTAYAAAGLGTLAGGAVKIWLPDNSGAVSSVDTLVTDTVTAVASKHMAAALPSLVAESLAAMRAATVAAVVAPAPAAAPAPVVAAPAAA